MNGITGYGAYLPYWRLRRARITEHLGSGGGRGTRSVAGYDEDSTSLGVEAGRRVLRVLPDAVPRLVCFATTSPAYLDKTNATAIHAALRLDRHVPAFDAAGSARSGAAGSLGSSSLVSSRGRSGTCSRAESRSGQQAPQVSWSLDDPRLTWAAAVSHLTASSSTEAIET